jgi:hypothetical protein
MMMGKWPAYYILSNKVPMAVDMWTWANWLEKNEQRVSRTVINSKCDVSTVFLGLDHNFNETGDPLLFETMIFGGPMDQEQWRCSTWKQAEAMHDNAVEKARKACEQVNEILEAAKGKDR